MPLHLREHLHGSARMQAPQNLAQSVMRCGRAKSARPSGDTRSGLRAGYTYSTLGAEPGVLIPTVVHTSPDNSSVLGTLQSSNEYAVYAPSANSDSGFDVRCRPAAHSRS